MASTVVKSLSVQYADSFPAASRTLTCHQYCWAVVNVAGLHVVALIQVEFSSADGNVLPLLSSSK